MGAIRNVADFKMIKMLLPLIFSNPALSNPSVLFRGEHGIGKSAIPKWWARRQGLPLLDQRLSLYTEGDLLGIPHHDKINTTGVTTFAPPSWLATACASPVVLFLDEINRASVAVQNSAFQLILDREIHGMKLHPETVIFAAVNDGPQYAVNEMEPALLSRFVVYDLVPTPEEWVEWAGSDGGVDEVLVDFIRHHPEHMRPTKAVEPGSVVPDQRAWERVDKMLKAARLSPTTVVGTNPPGFYALVMGSVGAPTAQAFCDWVQNYRFNISIDDIVNSWSEKRDIIIALPAEKRLALAEAAGRLTHGPNLSNDAMWNVAEWGRTLTGEQMAKLVEHLMSGVVGAGGGAPQVNEHNLVGIYYGRPGGRSGTNATLTNSKGVKTEGFFPLFSRHLEAANALKEQQKG